MAPAGTVAVICLDVSTLRVVAAVPLKLTPAPEWKPLPVIVTDVPTAPESGLDELTAGRIWNCVALVAVPPGVVTVMNPVVVSGIVAWIEVDVGFPKSVMNAVTPLNFTDVTPSNVVPVMMMLAEPEGALRLVIVGFTLKLGPLTAAAPLTLTETAPVVAPAGTVVRMVVAVTVPTVAVVPLNFTAVWPDTKPVPVIVTASPTGAPSDGE